MKTTGRYSAHEETERNPSKPFIDDIKNDIKRIEEFYLKKVGDEIKKEMIKELLKTL